MAGQSARKQPAGVDESTFADPASRAEGPVLDVALNLRITRELDSQLRERAAAEQIPTSALVRRLLSEAMNGPTAPALTVAQVEKIVRRVSRETRAG